MSPDRPVRTKNGEHVAVFAAGTTLTVTIEADSSGNDDVHFHAGGQGLWIARAAAILGARTVLCTPVGGEPGRVLDALIEREAVTLAAVPVARVNPAYVDDRRSGRRERVAANAPGPLTRHEIDDLFSVVLTHALRSGLLVVTGRPHVQSIPPSFYERLGADTRAAGVRVVGDLHGEELDAFLDRGRIDLLKISDEDLAEDGHGYLPDAAAFGLLHDLLDRDIGDVVLSRGERSALAVLGGVAMTATTPEVAAADHRGSGDAMTGAFAVGLRRGLRNARLLAFGCGAGAASATRHGLATAGAALTAAYADRVVIESAGPPTQVPREVAAGPATTSTEDKLP